MTATHTQSLRAELAEVQKCLNLVANELDSPLREFVEQEIGSSSPPLRAGSVLASGIQRDDTTELKQRRIYLAAALEMLYIALSIHKYLLNDISATQGLADKTLIGTTILAGDFCFSKAAELAAQTNEPVVVAIFSESLKQVSEGHLRHLHGDREEIYDENPDLLRAGLRAAIHLCQFPAAIAQDVIATGEKFVCWLNSNVSPETVQSQQNDGQVQKLPQELEQQLNRLPTGQKERWLELVSLVRVPSNETGNGVK